MWRALSGDIEGICIIGVKFQNILDYYVNIEGLSQLVYEILMNLNEIVLRSNLYGMCNVFICV